MPIVRGGKLEAGNVKLKRADGWICHPRAFWCRVINLLMSTSARLIQRARRPSFALAGKVGQRRLVVKSLCRSAEHGRRTECAARMVMYQVNSGVVDADGNSL